MQYSTHAHTEKVYLDQPFAKLMWKAEGNSLHVEWRSYPSTEGFNEVITLQQYIIRKHGCTKVVVNNKGLHTPVADVTI